MKNTVQKLLTGPASGSHFLLREPRTNETIVADEDGTWTHPDFRWNLIPDEMELGQFFSDAGYELQAVMRNLHEDPVPSQVSRQHKGLLQNRHLVPAGCPSRNTKRFSCEIR